jgi:S1-C subfamily serine protease
MDDQPHTQLPRPETTDAAPAPPARRTRRLVAVVAATAVVAGAGGAGTGYAVGHSLGDSTSTTASNGTAQATTGNGSGVEPIPGTGWSWSGGQGSVPVPTDPYGSTGPHGQSSDAATKAGSEQLTGLVRIVSTMKYDGAKAAGTGMVLTPDGEVVTNHHVVEGATSIRVKVMSTAKSYVATVVGTDAKDDVAVLQLTGASGLSTVTPDPDGISVGDAVTAVGDANGTVDNFSAAPGKVLATGQTITTQDEATASGERLTGLVKISSDVVSGDSGGATYDSDGEVVAMTTAASSGGSDVDGYAVPIAKVLRIAGDLEGGVTGSGYGSGYPAFLGVALGQTGTTVQGVYAGTPAAAAGLSAGDRIIAVGSTTVQSARALHAAVARLSPGNRVAVAWTDAAGVSHTRTVTLATGPVE